MLEVVLERQDGQLHVADDAPGAEVDAGQGHDLMDRANRKSDVRHPSPRKKTISPGFLLYLSAFAKV